MKAHKATTMTMNHEEFFEFLRQTKGCKFINVMSLTEPKMNKTNNPFYGRVKKFTAVQMQFNYDYKKAVNNRLIKQGLEPTFDEQKMSWGHWVKDENLGLDMTNKVIEHKGELFIRTYCLRNSKPHTFYLIDGHLANAEETLLLKMYLKEKEEESKKQSECGLIEEYQVKPRTYKFSSLVAITMDKQRIFIT